MADHNPIAEIYGKTLRRIRRMKDMSQESLAFSSGLSRPYIWMLESGQQQPSLVVILRIARALETDIGEFFIEINEWLETQQQAE